MLLDDLDAFFVLGEFAIEVAIFPGKTTLPVLIKAIFDNEYYRVDDPTASYSATQPKLTVKTIDIQGLNQEDFVLVEGLKYTVQDIQPDGTGISVVILQEMSGYVDSYQE